MKSKKPKMKLTKRQEACVPFVGNSARVGKTASKISVILSESGLTTQESTAALLALVQYGMSRLGVMEMTIGSDAGQLHVHRTPTTKESGKKIPEETPSYIR